jgi:hypothetical protein
MDYVHLEEQIVMKLRVPMITALVLFLNAGIAAAQSMHYWLNTYGTKGQLLGGLVVGGVGDLSATYYNPGAVVKTTDQNLVLSTQAYELSSRTFTGLPGQINELKTVQFKLAPTIFAFRITRKDKPNQLVLSGLTRYQSEFRDAFYVIDTRDVISTSPGDEYFSGSLQLDIKTFEGWGGLTWSRAVHDRVGVGITQYIAYRQGRGSYSASAEAVGQGASPEGAAFIFEDTFDYWYVRTLWKLGVFVDYSPVTFGCTVTTPSVGFFGKGNVSYNRSSVNVDGSSSLASDYQDDVSTKYRTGLSIAGGVSYRFGKRDNSRIYVTVEWFDNVPEYAVLDPRPFDAQTNGEVIENTYSMALESVINFGLGYEHIFTDIFTLYGSVYRDASARLPTDDSRLVVVDWDLYHIAGGASFTIFNLNVTAGLEYAFGGAPVQRDYQGADGIIDDTENATATYRRLLFLFGFSFGF